MANQSAQQTFKTSVLIVSALIIGQLLFAGVAWYLHHSDSPPAGTEQIVNSVTYAWIALCVVGVIGALIIQQRIGGLAASPRTLEKIRDGQLTPLQVQVQITIMRALLEAGGLLGLVLYFLSGLQQVLIAALGYIVLCTVVFFPRRIWFAAFIV